MNRYPARENGRLPGEFTVIALKERQEG